MDRDGNPLTYQDIICCEDTIAEDIDRKLHTQKALTLIREKLNEREQKILILRYGLNNKPALTQRDVAKQLGISRSYVSRIEKKRAGKTAGKLLGRRFAACLKLYFCTIRLE